MLIRPSRKNDAWGRDIIEAMSTGLFIISTGNDKVFITNKKNGIIVKNWDSKEVARIIKLYLSNQNYYS